MVAFRHCVQSGSTHLRATRRAGSVVVIAAGATRQLGAQTLSVWLVDRQVELPPAEWAIVNRWARIDCELCSVRVLLGPSGRGRCRRFAAVLASRQAQSTLARRSSTSD